MTDVVPLDSTGRSGQLQQLRQILRRQGLLFLTLLGPQQFELGVSLE